MCERLIKNMKKTMTSVQWRKHCSIVSMSVIVHALANTIAKFDNKMTGFWQLLDVFLYMYNGVPIKAIVRH